MTNARRRGDWGIVLGAGPLIALAATLLVGCGESEIEPRSAASVAGDAWDPFTDEAPRESRAHQAPRSIPIPPPTALAIAQPCGSGAAASADSFDATYAPPRRARSISLGFVGDQPLTESPPTRPGWPWVSEPFYMQDRYVSNGGYRRGRRY